MHEEEDKTKDQVQNDPTFREDLEWLLKDLPSESKPKQGKKKIQHDRMGRPTVMTQETVQKLKAAFLMRCTVDEACQSAGIAKQTYYNFTKKVPDFLDLVQAWRDDIVLMSRRNLRADVAKGGLATSLEILRTARKDEFAPKSISASGSEVTAAELEAEARGEVEIMSEDEVEE